MTAAAFATLRDAAFARLAAAVPALAAHRTTSAAQAVTTLLAFAELHLTARTRANDVAPILAASPSHDGDPLAASLVALIDAAIAAPLRRARTGFACDLSGWVEEAGFVELQCLLVHDGATVDELGALANLAGAAIRSVGERAAALAAAHFAAITQRDLGGDIGRHGQLTDAAAWALVIDRTGDPDRPKLLRHRFQALDAYGAVAPTLAEPALTGAIDRGEPLAPLLAARLGIGAAQLRRLVGARSAADTLTAYDDVTKAVVELVAHDVPLARWPAGPDWLASPWRKTSARDFLPPDSLGADAHAADALGALREDILQPFAAERVSVLGISRHLAIDGFLRGLEVPRALLAAPERRLFLRGLRHAIVGARGPAAFAQAVAAWHRRAACAAAMRHEHTASRPGWPACCAPLRSPGGRFTLVPLTSAEELVREGDALDHCVGGYYDQCRRGDTHILSLRDNGARVATVELCLRVDGGGAKRLEVGQFKAHRNRRPEPHHHEALRLFVDALKSGDHPIASAALAAYAKRMRASGDYAWRSGPCRSRMRCKPGRYTGRCCRAGSRRR